MILLFCYNSSLFKFIILGFPLKKIFLALFAIHLYLYAADINNKVLISIPKQDSTQDSAIVKIPALDLKVGESGIITREVNGNTFILGTAIVDEINDDIASISTRDFNNIKDKYMPTPLASPSEGDKIIFRILYDKALLLAPNQSTYQEIVNANKSIDFIHPDVFISYLASDDINEPKKDDFRGFCDKFDIGLVFITKENSIDVLDCQSFRVIAQDSITLKDTNAQKPFFTRIGDESLGELLDMEKVGGYFDYYGNMQYD